MDFGINWGSCIEKIEGYEVATIKCILPLFQNIVTAAIIFSGIAAVFMIIFSGFRFIWARGDPKEIEGARATLTFAIVGLLFVLLSFFIIRLLADITGVPCIKYFGFEACI